MTFKPGASWRGDNDDHETFTIDDPTENWSRRIIVYGSEDLRNHIVKLLNENPLPKSPDYVQGWNEALDAAVKALSDMGSVADGMIERGVRALKRSAP